MSTSRPTTYTLVLLRHGESVWNEANRFTGWTEVPLSARGVEEASAAGRWLSGAGIQVDAVHTSVQGRAIQTANLALEALGRSWVPVSRHWRLNERHYGALQGLDKQETADRHGDEQVFAWRRGYDVTPPALAPEDDRQAKHDPRYAQLAPELLPSTESLADVVARVLPYWFDRLVPDLRVGKRLLVSAHGNSLRALIMHLEGLSPEAIAGVNIPTGAPQVFRLDERLIIIDRRAPSGAQPWSMGR